MRLVVTSDTHGFHRGMTVPDGDVLIHCGDWSRDFGSWKDVERFATWMSRQPHAFKVIVPGNHDWAVQREDGIPADGLFELVGVQMLGFRDENVVEHGGLRFAGAPWMPFPARHSGWAFERHDEELDVLWNKVPPADVLVTHVPPLGILDENHRGDHLGCPVLRRHVFDRIRPRLHVFGHVHESYGRRVEADVVFMNVCSNTRGTFVRDDAAMMTTVSMDIRDPVVVDLGVL